METKPTTPDSSIEFKHVPLEEAAKTESPAVYTAEMSQGDQARVTELKKTLETPVQSAPIPKKPETKPTVQETSSSLIEKYKTIGKKYYSGSSEKDLIAQGIAMESIDIKDKAVWGGLAVGTGYMLSLFGLAAANGVAMSTGTSLAGGVASLLSGTVSTAGLWGVGLGAAGAIGPVIMLGGTTYVVYQGGRKIMNMMAKKKLGGVMNVPASAH